MTKPIWIITAVLLVILATGVAIGSASSMGDADEVVTLAQCPAAVRKTIQAHLKGGTIKEIERTTDHGEVLYEVDVAGPRGIVEFDVSEDGTFRGHEYDGEEAEHEDDEADDDDDKGDDDDRVTVIRLHDAPEAVRRAFHEISGGAVATEVEQIIDDGITFYEIEYDDDDADDSVILSEAGEVIALENSVAGDDLPAAVVLALANAYPLATIAEADAIQLFYYQIELEQDGVMREVIVLSSGEIEGDEDHDDDDDDNGDDEDDD